MTGSPKYTVKLLIMERGNSVWRMGQFMQSKDTDLSSWHSTQTISFLFDYYQLITGLLYNILCIFNPISRVQSLCKVQTLTTTESTGVSWCTCVLAVTYHAV